MTNQMNDVVSPLDATPLPDRVDVADARRAGRLGHSKPTVANSVVLLIDHQIGLLASVREPAAAELRSNVMGLARTAAALSLPVLLTTSNAQWQNGDLLPELRALFPEQPVIRRTGIINAYEDPTFRDAFDALMTRTGRTHVIIAGVTLGTCTTFPTLSMLNDGHQVFPVIDAAGSWSRWEADAALARMVQAGAQPVSTFALACELQEDWKKPTADAMLAPFTANLPEYGYVIDNFWNNYGRKVVPDPFA